ncbi:DUF4352 domain-containing protein [Pseudokineococcus sp. 5B2Z-1]|uniref:DUF4352 domain-containing protein n=1 Tax=Pseudokineococcus sp. 5B2Z-1 TaxID=3132744 RepID=UPI0030A84363
MSSPTQYQPPAAAHHQPPAKGMAIAALVLGIVAILGCLIPLLNVFSLLLALVGLVLGIIAIRRVAKDSARFGGRGQAIAGVVLSVLAILGFILSNALFGAAVNSASEDPDVRAAVEELDQAAEAAEQAAPEETPSAAAPAPEPEPEPVEQAPEPEPEVGVGLGAPARDGDFEFVVNGVECGETSIGDEFLSTEAQGQFCIVAMSITNIGDSAGTFFGDNTYLLNEAGQQFSADTEAGIYLGDADSLLSEINPGNTLDGQVVFDVPSDMTPTAIELHDSAFSGGVTVQLQ